MSYPTSSGAAETVSYAPDAWGRPSQAGSYATDVAYFPNGQVESFSYGNGHSYLAQQNARQLTSNFSDGAGSTLDVSEDVAYDADGNITTVTDLASGSLRSKRFGYDALNRLTSASAPGLYGTEAYSYDALDNLRTRLTQGQTLTYHYDASNRLASLSQGASTLETLRYNAQGDTIAQNATTLNYDASHRLTGIQGLASYAYDAAGRRVRKQPASGAPTYYFYNQAGQLLFQYAAGTATATNYIHLGTRLVAQHDSANGQAGTVTYSYTDPQGTPLAKADAQGHILARYDYTPYGSPVATLGNPPNGPGYTGHVNDPESGLVYMQQRYYDPVTGRFLSPDPVTTYSNPLGAFNRYAYTKNNPITNIDPDGRSSTDDICMGNMRCITEGGGGGGGSASPAGSSGQTTIPTTSGISGAQTVNQMDIGRDAHSTLQTIALASSPSFFAETAHDSNGIYFGGRPDIGNADLRFLWEIKPLGGRNTGSAQLLGYLAMSGFRYAPGALPFFFSWK